MFSYTEDDANMKKVNNTLLASEIERLKGAIVVAEGMANILEALKVSDKPGVREAAEPKADQAEAEVKLLKSKLRKLEVTHSNN